LNFHGTPFVPTPAGQHGREGGQRREAGAELQERSDEASTHTLTAREGVLRPSSESGGTEGEQVSFLEKEYLACAGILKSRPQPTGI
jgi:hypothetical protein